METNTIEKLKSYSNFELAYEAIHELLITQPRASLSRLHRELKEMGIYKTDKAPFSKKDIEEIIVFIKSQWREQANETILDRRSRQLREIEYVKERLFEQRDYKTLERYLRLERDLLGTDVNSEMERNMKSIEAQERIKALEMARKQEELILSANEDDVFSFEE